MASISGPRSALTDFIEEQGIKVRGQKKAAETKVRQKAQRSVVRKKNRLSRPLEIGKLDTGRNSLEDIVLRKIFSFFHFELSMNDNQLELFSAYLSRNRLMNTQYFNYFLERSKNSLVVHNCSMVEDSNFLVKKKYRRLELHFCGQLTSQRLSCILRSSPDLEVLKITGGFLVKGFKLPKKLSVLDVSYCSNLNDNFIESINTTFAHLEELRLSHCYKLTERCRLRISILKLYVCETGLSDSFFVDIKEPSKVRELSISRCPNIKMNDFLHFSQLELLDTTESLHVSESKIPRKCSYLNLEGCTNIKRLPGHKSLQVLNVSRINFSKRELKKITKLDRLKEVNLSWSSAVNDDLVVDMANKLPLKRLYVFGCFKLTSRIGELAWNISTRLKIIGNPAETSFLLNRE